MTGSSSNSPKWPIVPRHRGTYPASF